MHVGNFGFWLFFGLRRPCFTQKYFLKKYKKHIKSFFKDIMFTKLRISKLENYGKCVLQEIKTCFRGFVEAFVFEIWRLWKFEVLKLCNFETLGILNFETFDNTWYVLERYNRIMLVFLAFGVPFNLAILKHSHIAT